MRARTVAVALVVFAVAGCRDITGLSDVRFSAATAGGMANGGHGGEGGDAGMGGAATGGEGGAGGTGGSGPTLCTSNQDCAVDEVCKSQVCYMPWIWQKTIAGPANDFVYAVAAASDSGDVLAGGTAGGTSALSFRADIGGNTLVVPFHEGTGSYARIQAVALSAAGYPFLGFTYNGEIRFDQGGSLNTADGFDAAVVSYDYLDADYRWTELVADAGNESIASLAVDDASNIYTLGDFTGDLTFDALPTLTATDKDVFIARHSYSGVAQWSLSFGTTGQPDVPRHVAVRDGFVVITGRANLPIDFGQGELPAGGFVVKLDTDGNVTWARTYPGVSCLAAAIDSQGAILFGGAFGGPFTFGDDEATAAITGTDAFVAKLSADGSPLWMRAFGGTYDDAVHGVAVDGSDHVFAVGDFIGTMTVEGEVLVGADEQFGGDVFMAMFDPAGQREWARGYGAPEQQTASDVAYNVAADAMAVGGFFLGSLEFRETLTSDVGFDGFVLMLRP